MLLTSDITHTLLIVYTGKVGAEVSHKIPDF